jgi:hypothetical protein
MRPDYSGNGLVNLMASITEGCGGAPRHPLLRILQPDELRAARNVVLLIIDGLGDRYLVRRGAGSTLAGMRRGAMTSVFPTTTASAITTSYTGCAPREHGVTGWFAYFGEAGCVGAPLPFVSRGDQQSLRTRGVSPAQIFTAPALFASLRVASYVVTSSDIIDSDYNVRHCAGSVRMPYETAAQLVDQVSAAVKSGAQRKFVYAYWPHYDRVSHRHGSESGESLAELEKIDLAYRALLERLRGTDSLVIATADHGFVDVAREESLDLPPALAALLRFPLCGERRLAYCHVHSPQEFMDRARDWLGERAEVRVSAELVEEGWFGPGQAHPRLSERVGDVTLVMRDHYTVKDWTPGEHRHLHIGNHGGTSAEEMMIPLLVANT